ncbi:hypothetical protein A2526_01775 [candidate division WOR-1 bacterium RIFOXYD2_FULL_36_8]|uniref:DUF5723 domain-containing protein n=1 Tax=candidate division WOR-1 bacterium RIFOXYB2_FULL_36_35 TaxID=1802578 RepID=A0A1F4S406_UNCSA|nr:MAG: hypothetical protein A2230_02955 [candidate division WOR-1 bacterium RIFOXYA2_FULL_36_21]OGC15136.1 MAG: hypothetical protein A2282_08985 [candidate division WOR-1 bacterium RIFOXYA12_FULL_36_13]OGC15164.1 MAG: hypothetical protein A2290_08865 [candidate division WOR-1 bacterium RIFOXYB2_FULL_36_35]OGC41835.1 MAG: hypothetical protein A2526_01775 [candidate division WOR-1 bacterium RIFOXYD2_FULL_36_8]
MKINTIISILTLFFFTSTAALALYGARPMGMGGAFTSISNDTNAAYWNPAGFAINPGVDIYGTTLVNNRNQIIGENLAAIKMCFETELNPFAWIIGVGAISLLAYNGAKYLSNQGIIKKNWDRKEEKHTKEEAVSKDVLEEGGTEQTEDVKEKAENAVEKTITSALDSTTSAIGAAGNAIATTVTPKIYWGPVYYPWYQRNYKRPTYWDEPEIRKEKISYGKAQFAAGLSFLTDKNSLLDQNTDFYTFSLATAYEQRVALGVNLNLYHIKIPSTSLDGLGGGLDLGIIIRPTDNLALGATAKEILTTDVQFENGTSIRYEPVINLGIALNPIDMLTISADTHNIFTNGQTYHYGMECKPFPGLALRAGMFDENKTAGTSIMINQLIIDYAYLGGLFNRTQIVGATWKL